MPEPVKLDDLARTSFTLREQLQVIIDIATLQGDIIVLLRDGVVQSQGAKKAVDELAERSGKLIDHMLKIFEEELSREEGEGAGDG